MNQFEAQPAAEPIEWVSLVHGHGAVAAAELLADADDCLELDAGDRVTSQSVTRGREGSQAIKPLAGSVNPLILVVRFDVVSGQPMRQVVVQSLRDPVRPDVGIQKGKRQWGRNAGFGLGIGSQKPAQLLFCFVRASRPAGWIVGACRE